MTRVVALAVRLVGPPSVSDGRTSRPPPRGRKVWALLAYLMMAERPPARSWLAGLLFSDAEDPLGALRWSLAELRRLLGPGARVYGDPVILELPEGAQTDVRRAFDGRPPGIDAAMPGEFLEGLNMDGAPGFEAWLTATRRQVAVDLNARARRRVMEHLAAGQEGAHAAAGLAAAMVESDPLDEGTQALLIRSLVAAGDRQGALRQFEAAREHLRRELGTDPGPDLMSAAEAAREMPPAPSTGSRPGLLSRARADLRAGQAAIGAGALDSGFAALRSAIAAASDAGDRLLEAAALAELGSALIHSVRGRDGEGAATLHIALGLAQEQASSPLAAQCLGQLGWIELLAGSYSMADDYFVRASILLDEDPGSRSWTDANRGIALADMGRHEQGLAIMSEAAKLADTAGHMKNLCWVEAFIGRSRLLRNEPELARLSLESSLRLAGEHWPYFIPWPESLLGDMALLEGRPDEAARLYEDAFAHACRLADPCWEGMSLRGLGCLAIASGDTSEGIRQLEEACARATSFDDTYHWAIAYCRDSLAQAALTAGSQHAESWARELVTMSGRLGMSEFGARANLYLCELGDSTALKAAQALAADVENPSLTVAIESHAASHA